MQVNFIDWSNSNKWQQAKNTIGEAVRRACGTGWPDAICDVFPRPGGIGIVMALRHRGNRAPVIALGEEWQEPMVIEGKVREVLADLKDQQRVERQLAQPLDY